MKRNEHISAAMRAHTNLTVFAAVVEILEGGCVCGESRAANQIIAICKKEQQRQLKKMDAAVIRAQKGTQ